MMVELHDLTVGYGRAAVLRQLTGRFAPGVTAVVGPNGAGKSTLLKTIAGLLRPLGGKVQIAGGPGSVAFLPQLAELDRSFPISVQDVVQLGLWPRIGPWRGLRGRERREVEAALAELELTDVARQQIGRLSQGQLQRTLFARLILQDRPILLLDEPFAAVDEPTTAALAGVLRRWQAAGRTVIIVLHDLDQVRALSTETLLLAGNAPAWGDTGAVLTGADLPHAWEMPKLAHRMAPSRPAEVVA